MKNIILPKYIKNYNLSSIQEEEQANAFGFSFEKSKENNDSYNLYWGYFPFSHDYGTKYGIMESGFFNNAQFIDTVGAYQTCSLNTKYAYDQIENFELNGRLSAKDIIFSLEPNKQSKFNPCHKEKNTPEDWNGVILALQNPKDRSIHMVTDTKKYYEFVDECCKFYGKNLFVKMHPWNSGEVYDSLAEIAKKHGCLYGKTSIDIIKNCEFVISYNSTFAIDCLLRDVPYVQYGMGTFYDTYGIIYSKQTFPKQVEKKKNMNKLCDFLIHKYCFNKNMQVEKYAKMIRHFSESDEIFPMTDEFSYASNINFKNNG
jgi:hypothetical protein